VSRQRRQARRRPIRLSRHSGGHCCRSSRVVASLPFWRACFSCFYFCCPRTRSAVQWESAAAMRRRAFGRRHRREAQHQQQSRDQAVLLSGRGSLRTPCSSPPSCWHRCLKRPPAPGVSTLNPSGTPRPRSNQHFLLPQSIHCVILPALFAYSFPLIGPFHFHSSFTTDTSTLRAHHHLHSFTTLVNPRSLIASLALSALSNPPR
jgi:hypothetical protein